MFLFASRSKQIQLPCIVVLCCSASLLSLCARHAAAGPCRGKYSCRDDHLRKAPLHSSPLPRPGQRRAGRFISSLGLPTGPRARARRGDYYVRSHRLLATVRADDGALIDLALGPPFADRLGWGEVRICDSEGVHEVHVRRFVTQRESLVVFGEAAGAFSVETHYEIVPRRTALKITTWITNNSDRARRQVRVCDNYGLTSTPLFISGHGVRQSTAVERRVQAPFCVRSEPTDSGEVSFLLASLGAPIGFRLHRASRLYDPPLPIDADYRWQRIEPRHRVLGARRLLVVREGPAHRALAELLDARRVRTQTLRVAHTLVVGGTELIVERNNAPYLRTQLFGPQTTPGPAQREVSLKLPASGRYRLSLLVPGVGVGPPLQLTEATMKLIAVPTAPAMGRLVVEINAARHTGSARALLPSKIVFAGQPGTPTPDFGRRGDARVDNVIYTHGQAEVWLAPGRYGLQISSGPLRDLVNARVAVSKGQTVRLRRRLHQPITTPGWISADLHTHSNASVDSALSATTRLLAAAATGTQLVVATNHNAVTDYTAAVARVGQLLGAYLPLAIRGQEVTTSGNAFGHFNAFPLPATKPLLPWRFTSPFALFSAARRTKPPALLQVNHPHMTRIGYFNLMGLDPATGQARGSGYRGDFDLLEVANGDLIGDWSRLTSNFQAWFALLNLGKRYVATGNSDAHILPVQDAGYPRNYILWRSAPTTQPAASAPAERTRIIEPLLAALRAGRCFVSTGPVVDFTIDGQPLGSQIVPRSSKLQLKLLVQAAPWVKLERVELYANGAQQRLWDLNRASRRTRRLRRAWKLPRPARDTWYVVVVSGSAGDPTQQRAVLPFALTNPIWVDADGDGRFSPAKGTRARKDGGS